MPGATSAEFVLPIYEPLQVIVANVLKSHMALGQLHCAASRAEKWNTPGYSSQKTSEGCFSLN